MKIIMKKGPDTDTKTLGFTLIELLIVMAILGVLAVVVLVAINPVQQLARTRDAGRKSAVAQVGRALEAFYTTHGGRYLLASNCNTDADPDLGPDWMTCLQDSGEMSSPAAEITYSVSGVTACVTQTISGIVHVEHNNLCYAVNTAGDEAIVYSRLESNSDASKCTTSGNIPFFVWSTRDGRGGIVCISGTGVPTPGTQIWDSAQQG